MQGKVCPHDLEPICVVVHGKGRPLISYCLGLNRRLNIKHRVSLDTRPARPNARLLRRNPLAENRRKKKDFQERRGGAVALAFLVSVGNRQTRQTSVGLRRDVAAKPGERELPVASTCGHVKESQKCLQPRAW